MTTEVILPLTSYADGPTASDVVDVPDAATTVMLRVRRCTTLMPDVWPNAETFGYVDAEINIGSGWEELANGNVEGWGDIQKNKFGNDIEWMWFDVSLPSGTGRQIRATITVTDGPLRSEGETVFND